MDSYVSRFHCARVFTQQFSQQEKAAYTGGRRVDHRSGSIGHGTELAASDLSIPLRSIFHRTLICRQEREREREREHPRRHAPLFYFPHRRSVRVIEQSEVDAPFHTFNYCESIFFIPCDNIYNSPRISSKRYVGREIVLTLYRCS